MSNQTTSVNSDDTRLDTGNQRVNNSNTQSERTEVPSARNTAAPSGSNKSNTMARGIAFGGLGVIAGVAGAMGVAAARQAPAVEDPASSETSGTSGSSGASAIHAPESLDDIKMAHTPNDDMSFNSAFATAREEVGAHGVFEWRGGVYHTYYAGEWANLPDDYKQQMGNHNWRADFANDPNHIAQHHHQPDEPHNHLTHNTVGHSTPETFGEHEIKTDSQGHEYISLTDAVTGKEIHISPDDLKYAVVDERGEVVAILGEHDAADVSGTITSDDGHAHAMVFDENGNFVGVIHDEIIDGELRADYANEGDVLHPHAAFTEGEEIVSVDDEVSVLYADAHDEGVYIPTIGDGSEAAYVDHDVDGHYDVAVVDDAELSYADFPDAEHGTSDAHLYAADFPDTQSPDDFIDGHHLYI
jgi:hypothetical protein